VLRERCLSIRLRRNWKITVPDDVFLFLHSELVVKRSPFDAQKMVNGFNRFQLRYPGSK
jgi:hypothetical protein